MKKAIVGISLILMTVVFFSACAGGTTVPSGERVFNINAIEIKGATGRHSTTGYKPGDAR